MPFPAHCFLLLENQLLSGCEFVGKYLQIGIDPAQKRDGDFALISALFYEHIVFLTFRPDCAGRDMEDMVGIAGEEDHTDFFADLETVVFAAVSGQTVICDGGGNIGSQNIALFQFASRLDSLPD